MNLLTKATQFTRSPGDPQVIESGRSSRRMEDQVTRALGWFSYGLGAAELFAAKPLARAIGMEGREGLLRAYGAREIGAGMLCLSTEERVGMWSRVAGDMVDIGTLMTAKPKNSKARRNLGIALGAVVGITLLDLWTATKVQKRHSRREEGKRDYSDRSGWPKGIEHSRGAASGLNKPSDMRAAPTLASVSSTSGETSTSNRSLERQPQMMD